MPRILSRFFLGLSILAVLACVDLYDPGLSGTNPRLVVECHITTQADYQYVYLTFDAPFNNTSNIFTNPVRRAKVSITDSNGQQYEFFDDPTPSNKINTKEGYNYRSFEKFAAQIGHTYTLNIETLIGQKYQAISDKVSPVTAIEKVHTKFRQLPVGSKLVGTFDVYIDSPDPATETNFYKWDSFHVFQQGFCREWYVFGRDGSVTVSNVDRCCGSCFQKELCDECYQLGNDKLINGKKIVGQYITSVPYSDITPYYLSIRQFGLSEAAYRYWKTVQEQSKNSGGLFDATPKSIKGNIRSLSQANEEVLGFFMATDVKQTNINIDRNLANPKPRVVLPYVGTNWIITPDCYPCQESYNRSKTPPPGWL
jgi:hypothetical protein